MEITSIGLTLAGRIYIILTKIFTHRWELTLARGLMSTGCGGLGGLMSARGPKC
jgi:hypothetical protein